MRLGSVLGIHGYSCIDKYLGNVQLTCPDDRSAWNHLFACCEVLGIPDARGALGRMLTVDYIIANIDRHWNNFGFIRNADTTKFLGLAPVYDSGTSL